jgi:pyrroloquinoline quinone (PQQ) biosynthesis protein C
MGFTKDFMHNHHCPMAVTSSQQAAGEDMFNGNIVSDVVDMKDWGACLFIVKKLAGAVGTATATIKACDDIVPTTRSSALTFYYRKMTTADTWAADWATSASLSIAAGADEIWEILVTADQVQATAATYHYIELTLTEVDSTAVDGTVFCMLIDPRYAKGSTVVDSVID